jgi:hypothetical protein
MANLLTDYLDFVKGLVENPENEIYLLINIFPRQKDSRNNLITCSRFEDSITVHLELFD